MIARVALAAAFSACVGHHALAQSPVAVPAARPMVSVEQSVSGLFTTVSTVRALSDGRILVNDLSGRKVVLLDSLLAQLVVVADTTLATAHAYGSRAVGLIPFRGDSTLIVDPAGLTMMVATPSGAITRVLAIPRAPDANQLLGGSAGTPGFDARGRLVYLQVPLIKPPLPAPAGSPGSRDPKLNLPQLPDSAPLIAIDLGTRAVDTLGLVRVFKPTMRITETGNGGIGMKSLTNPMPQVDDWALLADGTVAFIRGQEYRVDWLRPDGSRTSTPKLPFAWRRLTDADKATYLDSVMAVMERLRTEATSRLVPGVAGVDPAMLGGLAVAGVGDPAGMREMKIEIGGSDKGRDEPRRSPQEAGGNGADRRAGENGIRPLQFVEPGDLPDYVPAFGPGSARGDAAGNLWIRTSNTLDGGAVYDVFDSSGTLVDRVGVAAGRVIVGFGPKGAVYVTVREPGGARLELVRFRARAAIP